MPLEPMLVLCLLFHSTPGVQGPLLQTAIAGLLRAARSPGVVIAALAARAFLFVDCAAGRACARSFGVTHAYADCLSNAESLPRTIVSLLESNVVARSAPGAGQVCPSDLPWLYTLD
jgi:hypothetical protein